jgi:hypothetical protein
MAHACSPNYSGGRDQKDGGLKPTWANSSWNPISKNPSKKGLVEWLKVEALNSSPSAAKKKKTLTALGTYYGVRNGYKSINQ